MKEERMLMTGFRLLAILNILYNKDASKTEILQELKNKYNIKDFSKETIKLDINTLINAGFNIERGNRARDYKLHLDKNFIMLKFNVNDLYMLISVKNAAMEFLNYGQIMCLQRFFKKIIPYIQANCKNLNDFNFFNSINTELLKSLEGRFNKYCTIIYNSPSAGRVEIETVPRQIVYRGGKLYLRCFTEKSKERTTLRLDNIKSVSDGAEKLKEIEIKPPRPKKKFKYKISKKFYENYPLERAEKIIDTQENTIEIETDENDDFFVMQRLLCLGKNCMGIESKRLKNRIIENLQQTMRQYKKC